MKRTLFIGIVAVALVMGLAAYATAASVTDNGTNSTGTVTVTASVNPKLTLTIDDSALAFGALDPDATGSGNAVLTVSSNKTFIIMRGDETNFTASTGTATSMLEAIGLTVATDDTWTYAATNTKGKNLTFNDVYSYSVPWTSEPADYSAQYVYTVTQ